MDLPEDRVTWRRRRSLPHMERENAIYFVTYRLADSLPVTTLRRIGAELRQCKDGAHRRRRLEDELDRSRGHCWLRRPAVARLVAESMMRCDRDRYVLGPWCLMPNHVHVLFRPLPPWTLARILHSWKSYTAGAANGLLGRRGSFWQKEYYDHLVRDMRDLDRKARYIQENPERAGLKNWPWLGKGSPNLCARGD